MPQITKKRKRDESNGSVVNVKEIRQKIKVLEASLSDKKNLNNLVELLDIAKSTTKYPAQVIHAAIHAIHRVFTRLQLNGDLVQPRKAEEQTAKGKVTLWILEQYEEYIRLLLSLLEHDEPGLQIPALNILMALLKSDAEYQVSKSKKYIFNYAYYERIVCAFVEHSALSQPLQNEFVEKYVNAYDDLRYYFYKTAAVIMTLTSNKEQGIDATAAQKKKMKLDGDATSTTTSRSDLQRMAQNVFGIVESIRSMPTEPSEIDEFWTWNPDESKKSSQKEDDSAAMNDEEELLLGDSGLVTDEEDEEEEGKDSGKSKSSGKKNKKHTLLQLTNHKREFAKCWVALLRLPLTEEIYKKTLLILHKRILPHMTEPRMLMDFLTDAYNVGGAVSLLALNGLFVLVTEHNLEYPDFYHKLYVLLDRNVLHVKYRSRFFRLLDIFLSSTLLPANLVASFIKRLARLSLSAPPAASVAIIPFIYNLMRRHPTCMKLIHSDKDIGEENDPYDFDEKNPYESRALESSLWEVQTLAQHYYANVSTLAKIFSEKFLKPKYDLEDFLDHTYATFFKTEIERKRKKVPALAFEKPGACEWEI